MKLADLPDDFTPEQFRQLDRESLEEVPFTRATWVCQCKGCTRGTMVRDYGLAPWYWLQRNSKRSHAQPQRYWFYLDTWHWLCSKHNAMFKKLAKRFDIGHIQQRFLDPGKTKIVPLPDKDNMDTVKQIEK